MNLAFGLIRYDDDDDDDLGSNGTENLLVIFFFYTSPGISFLFFVLRSKSSFVFGVRGEEFGGYLFFFFLLFISSFIFIAHWPVTFDLSAQCICSNLHAPFQRLQ